MLRNILRCFVSITCPYADRLSEVQKWNTKLEDTKSALQAEIGRLLAARDQIESHTQYVATFPTDVNRNNTDARANRAGIDLVRDNVEVQLGVETTALQQVYRICLMKFSSN